MKITALTTAILLATTAQAGPILTVESPEPEQPRADMELPPVDFLIDEILAEFDLTSE